MHKLFIGLIFIMLDFYMNAGDATIGVLPDFVGYLFLYKGLQELADESARFPKLINWTLGMAIFSGVLYIMDLLALPVQLAFVGWLLNIAAQGVFFWILFQIICGIREMELYKSVELKSHRMKSLWQVWIGVAAIAELCSWIPAVGFIAAIATMIVSVCFLVAFYQAQKQYRE